MKKTMAGGVSSTARWIGGGRTEDDDGKSFDSGDVEVEAVVGEIGKRAMEVGELPMRRI